MVRRHDRDALVRVVDHRLDVEMTALRQPVERARDRDVRRQRLERGTSTERARPTSISAGTISFQTSTTSTGRYSGAGSVSPLTTSSAAADARLGSLRPMRDRRAALALANGGGLRLPAAH
jgi:hypothetical protein